MKPDSPCQGHQLHYLYNRCKDRSGHGQAERKRGEQEHLRLVAKPKVFPCVLVDRDVKIGGLIGLSTTPITPECEKP